MKFLFLLPIFILLSCSVKNNLDQIRSSSEETSNVSKEMNKKLNQANISSCEELKMEITEHRNRIFNNLKMEISFHGKMIQAKEFLQSFEFQILPLNCIQNVDQLKNKAAKEFNTRLNDLYSVADDIDNISISSNKQSDLNILALAMQLDKDIFDKKYKSIPFLIESSLKSSQKSNAGEIKYSDIEEYKKELLKQEELLLHILQIRYNIFLGLIFKDLSDIQIIEKKNFFKKIFILPKLIGLEKSTFMKPWKADLDNITQAEQLELINKAKKAHSVKKILNDLEIDPTTEYNIQKALENVEIVSLNKLCDNCDNNATLLEDLINNFSN